jgi:hypothetical protein
MDAVERAGARIACRALVVAVSVGLPLLTIGVTSGLGATPSRPALARRSHTHVVYRAKQACPSPRHPARGRFVHPTMCRAAAKDKAKRVPTRKGKRKPAPKKQPPKKPVPHKPSPKKPTGTGSTTASPPTQPPAANPAPAPGPPSTPSQPAGATAWEEPALVHPTVVTLSDSNRSVTLDQSKDYIVQCPSGQFDVSAKITIWGGHNVVFQNCDEYMTNPSGDWAAYLEDQTGTLWIHDVHFGGAHLTGGVQMQEPGATVVMRDVLFDTVYGSYSTNHAECMQTWSGPARLLIDGLQCSTTYQGLFLLPNQWDSTTLETTWDFRNVQIDGDGAYDLWLGNVQPSQVGALGVFNVQNVYDCGTGEPRDWDGTSDGNQAWADVKSCPSGNVPKPVWANPDGSVTGEDDGTSPEPVAGEQA